MESQSGKCNEKSRQLSSEGDEFRLQSQPYEAVLLYNKSLCFAPVGSPELISAFIGRCKVYFGVKQYEKCLENVRLARQHGCSSDELNELEGDCQKLLKDEKPVDDPWDFFKLSFPPHEKIPYIANCLKPHETWQYGRCVITSKKLKPGDVIAIEEPLFRMLNKAARYSRCANCMKSNAMSLIPCSGKCTTSELVRFPQSPQMKFF